MAARTLDYATLSEAPPQLSYLGVAALNCGALAVASLGIQWFHTAGGGAVIGGPVGLFCVPVLGAVAIVFGAFAAGTVIVRLPALVGLGAGIATVVGWLAFLVYLVATAWHCC